jgi:hypothetical protein
MDSLLSTMLSVVEAHTRLPRAELQINFMLARPYAEQHRENPGIIQFAWEPPATYSDALVLQRYLNRGTAGDFALPVHADHQRCLPGAPTAYAQGTPVYFDVSSIGSLDALTSKQRKQARDYFDTQKFTCFLSVPILARRDRIGVINIDCTQPGFGGATPDPLALAALLMPFAVLFGSVAPRAGASPAGKVKDDH